MHGFFDKVRQSVRNPQPSPEVSGKT